jgi:hypothetical protein
MPIDFAKVIMKYPVMSKIKAIASPPKLLIEKLSLFSSVSIAIVSIKAKATEIFFPDLPGYFLPNTK